MANKTSGSKGLFASIQEQGKKQEDKIENSLELENINSLESKNQNTLEVKNLDSQEELSVKRSYSLRASTIKKLEELKVFVYLDPSTKYNDIVDEAICLLYEKKKEKKESGV